MSETAELRIEPPQVTAALQYMSITVLEIAEWLVKQQQLLKQQQRLLKEKQHQIEAQEKQIEELKDSLDKLKNRDSHNSSLPPSQDLLKKSSDKSQRKKGKKRGPKYNHPGKTRNGFGTPDQVVPLELENCPVCGTELEIVEGAPQQVQQVAEVVSQPIEIREYRRPLYQCPNCGWSGYSCLPWGVKEGFSYGSRLCSIVGWERLWGQSNMAKTGIFYRIRFGSSYFSGQLSKNAALVSGKFVTFLSAVVKLRQGAWSALCR